MCVVSFARLDVFGRHTYCILMQLRIYEIIGKSVYDNQQKKSWLSVENIA